MVLYQVQAVEISSPRIPKVGSKIHYSSDCDCDCEKHRGKVLRFLSSLRPRIRPLRKIIYQLKQTVQIITHLCSLSHLMLTMDASLNFLVYSCCTTPFRARMAHLLEVLGRCTNTAPPRIERGTEMIRQGISRAQSRISKQGSLPEEEPILNQEVLV